MTVFLFSDFFEKRTGGMEVHQEAFLQYYPDTFQLVKSCGRIDIYHRGSHVIQCLELAECILWLKKMCQEQVIFFFNNLSWLLELEILRIVFPKVKFVMRSGGNDIYKAMAKISGMTLEEKITQTANIINCFTDKLIINSNYSYLRNLEAGILSKKMIKIRGGVPKEFIVRNVRERRYNRSKFDYIYGTEGKKILLIASRLVPFKGIPEFICELHQYQQYAEWHLVIVGSGTMKENVLQTLHKLIPPENWTFFDEMSHEETLKLISIADLFVNFSLEYQEHIDGSSFIHTETMGRGMMEAISQEIPILALDSGGTSELFEENQQIGWLLATPEETSKCLQAFLKYNYKVQCHSDYTWDNVFERYDELFRILHDHNGKKMIVFDFDGTIMTQDTDFQALCEFMQKEKSENIYTCLTARSREEALPLMEQLSLDYLVYENGAGMISSHYGDGYWNRLSEMEQQKLMTEMIFQKISAFADCKITHPFTIHMKQSAQSEKWIMEIKEIIRNMPYQIISSEKYIKIQHKVLNKRGALEYILKDGCFSFTVSAGDGLNDVGFIQLCDIGFVWDELVAYMPYNFSKAYTFNKDEIGIPLLKRMLEIIRKRDNHDF